MIPITDKIVRVSLESWSRLRDYAYLNNSKIKSVADGIISGKIDAVTGKTLKNDI